MTKNCGQEITKAREILKKQRLMKESVKEPERQSTTRLNNTLRQDTRQQTQSSRGVPTRTKRQFQAHMISV